MGEIKKTEIRTLPLLPLKNSVLFPGLLMPLSVGRPGSIAAVEAALATEEKEIVMVAQRDANEDTPNAADLFTIGTRAAIRRAHRPKADQHGSDGDRPGACRDRQGRGNRPASLGARAHAAGCRTIPAGNGSADAFDHRAGHEVRELPPAV